MSSSQWPVSGGTSHQNAHRSLGLSCRMWLPIADIKAYEARLPKPNCLHTEGNRILYSCYVLLFIIHFPQNVISLKDDMFILTASRPLAFGLPYLKENKVNIRRI